LQAQRVVGIQHHRIFRDFDRYTLDLGQLLERFDAAQPKVIARDIDTGRHIATVVAETTAQHAPPRRLHDGGIDGRVAQDHLRRLRTGHVTRYGHLPSI
jgi:hypothetical protein